MKLVDLRLDAPWIVPIEPEGALADHSLLINNDRIVALVPRTQADRDYVAAKTVELGSHVLLPGLVNAHTHAAMTLLRGIADDIPLHHWLEQHIWPREGRHVSSEFVYDGTLHGAAEMLLGGTTCCSDMYFFPGSAAQAFQRAGMRAMLGLPILEFATPYASTADQYLQQGLEVRDQWKYEERLRFSFAPHAPYTVSDSTWETIVTYSRQLDLPIQTHLHETDAEIKQSLTTHGTRPLVRIDALGATGPSFIAIHAVHLNPGDIELLQRHGCHVIHCPTSNLKLASGIAPLTALCAADINVGLGTDGAASNNRLDLFAEARLASLLAKVQADDASAIPAYKALRLATLGGAAALGMEAEIGSFIAGKAADVIAVNLDGVAQAPCYDVMSHLVHVSGRDQVSDVWVAGKQLVKEGELTDLDSQEIIAKAKQWQELLR